MSWGPQVCWGIGLKEKCVKRVEFAVIYNRHLFKWLFINILEILEDIQRRRQYKGIWLLKIQQNFILSENVIKFINIKNLEDHWSCITHLLKSGAKSLKLVNLSDLDQGHWMTYQGHWMSLTYGTHTASCTHLVDYIYQLL